MSNLEVDSFGRTIPSRKPDLNERGAGRPYSRRNEYDNRHGNDRPHSRPSNYDGPGPSRRGGDDWVNRGLPPDREGGRFGNNRGYDRDNEEWQNRGPNYDRGNRGPMRNSGRGNMGRDFGGRGGRAPPPDLPPPHPPMIVKRITMPPLATFKNFMLNQPDDVSPELFQRRYEDFQFQYVMDFSTNFFENSKEEEWFRERYDPIKQHEIELETEKWAQTESSNFKKELLEFPKLAIDSLRLDPSSQTISNGVSSASAEKPVTGKQGRRGQDGDLSGDTMNEAMHVEGAAEGGSGSREDQPIDSSEQISSENLHEASENTLANTPDPEGGHASKSAQTLPSSLKRILYISGIPAECSRAVLAAAIAEASKGLAERVILSPPSWNKNPEKGFERNAWVVVPSKAIALELMATLKELQVAIPGPIDPITGEPSVASTFMMQVNLHAPRHHQTVPECASNPARVAHDIGRATELADLLDEVRKVPESQRIKSLLSPEISENSTLLSAIQKPADKLDIIIAYLRNVHFVVYYGGRKYCDEAQMLSFSPLPAKRTYPTVALDESVGGGVVAKAVVPTPSVPSLKASVALSVEENATHESKEEKPDVEPTVKTIETMVTEADVPALKTEAEPVAETTPEETVEETVLGKRKTDDDSGEMQEPTAPVPIAMEASAAVVKSGDEDGEVEEGQEREEGEEGEGDTSYRNRIALLDNPMVQQDWRRHPFLYSMDKRIDVIVNDLKAQLNPENQKLTPEQEELKEALAEQEKVLQAWETDLIKNEPEGKCRCAVEWCNKLFKGPDFLKKHIRAKHVDMAAGLLMRASVPFMRRRYEAEDLLARPLPLVPVEVSGGGIETRSVREILDRCGRLPRPQAPLRAPGLGLGIGGRGRGRGGPMGRGGRDFSDNRRWAGPGGDFPGGGGRFGRGGGGAPFFDNDRRPPGQQPFRGPNPNARPLVSYVDIDAPEVTPTALDYGSALLPPPKRRKLPGKKEETT